MNESVVALNEAVTRQASLLVSMLSKFNATLLIEELLGLNETLIRERRRWRSTALAIRSLYGIDEGTRVAAEVERVRARLQIALRALIEVAVCESDPELGSAPDTYGTDQLVGLMCVLCDLGRESDVIYYGFSRKGIELFPNGAHSFGAALLGDVADPYFSEVFGRQYASAAGNYKRWVNKEDALSGSNAQDRAVDDAKFGSAWDAEYGLTFESFLEIVGELQDIAVDRGTVVVRTNVSDVLSGRADRGVSEDDVRAFIRSFALRRRSSWLALPACATPKDIHPWRFQRKLSVSLRPLVCVDETCNTFIYGAGTLRESMDYIIDSIRSAIFDKELFVSQQMRSWIGSRIDELGRQFTHQVAETLVALGWNARCEVKLTQLGAPKNPNLGDVDIVAWQEDGRVLLIECKRLKSAKTIAEIAQSCERFRGNAGDRLHKHLRRCEWLRAHQEGLIRFVRTSAKHIQIYGLMVVSRPVPFKYVKDLPLKRSEIVDFDDLASWIEGTKQHRAIH
jgi:hypothetical protein